MSLGTEDVNELDAEQANDYEEHRETEVPELADEDLVTEMF